MNCKQVVELMTAYLEGALSPDDHARFEEHIAGCDGCTAYLAQMRMTRRVVGRLADEPIPEAVQKELVGAFRSWRSQHGGGLSEL
jgi:anti-sigma factor RsiW